MDAFRLLIFLCVVLSMAKSVRIRQRSGGKQGAKLFKHYAMGGSHTRRNASSDHLGMWPAVFNLATKAVIFANATCGEDGREEFCRFPTSGRGRCGICDSSTSDSGKKHPISYAIDGTNKWWQSPALYYGAQYEYVTITVDLKQIYQVTYIIIKTANSPRPGTWVLERSLDGILYKPWQYFVRTDEECFDRFGMQATPGRFHYVTDSDIICTSSYSNPTPVENAETHISLVHGRPGANESSPELLEFTKARYVKLRLIGIWGTESVNLYSRDTNQLKRLYYTIRDITIGGQCVCNGHAQNCRHNVASGHPECECGHHTCGPNCEKCCPLYNQQQWGPGTSRDARLCLACNCHGHSKSCHYDENVDRAGLSMDIHGNYQGGGVCDNCADFTIGINCERCLPGYYRPVGVHPSSEKPCTKCACDSYGSNGTCIQEGVEAGICVCRPGYAGPKCDSCALEYRGYPNCEKCPCNVDGTVRMENCEGECTCKTHVEGKYCDRCKPGYFGLGSHKTEGCTECYCSGVTTLCHSASTGYEKIQTLHNWQITNLNMSDLIKPTHDDKGIFAIGNYEFSDVEPLYWLAPDVYVVHWVIMRGDTSGKPTTGPNIVLIGTNGMRIAQGNDFFLSSNTTFSIRMMEDDWYHVMTKAQSAGEFKKKYYKGDAVSRQQFMSVLSHLRYVLLRATFHSDQIEALLEEATWSNRDKEDEKIYNNVEKCSCPSGYTGLSCESCAFGYVKITITRNQSSSLIPLEQEFCGKCDCNGHSESCNADTGECFCQHNTVGENCERCTPGFYGNPLIGTPDDCKRCACPLDNDENNFSPSCQLDYFAESDSKEERESYVCTQCPKGYTSDHCEICDDGYFGNPLEVGNSCKPCDCGGGPCDRKTGQCQNCKGNTDGWKCEKCKLGYYGDASSSNCISCQCDPIGSVSKECDNETGQCRCKERFTGRTCDRCQTGFGNVSALCTACACNSLGSKSSVCDSHTGLCDCRQGVEGFHCDACQNLHYGFSNHGCKACNCDVDGSKFASCNLTTGQCMCKPNFTGLKCDKCLDGFWKADKKCISCSCDKDGSLHQDCHPKTGACTCKPGVGGLYCNSCLPNYFGNIFTECKECEPCNKKGHICHPTTGKCVCPPLATGKHCEKCQQNAWGYEPGMGCKDCECSTSGSLSPSCDAVSGRCTCKPGYEGEKCNRCSLGYYGYEDCRKCNCNILGTVPEDCSNDACRCGDGGCRCKANVIGRYCDVCKNGTFGLEADNTLGCTDCFCFGRSKKCTASRYSWDQVRTMEVEHIDCALDRPCWKLPIKFTGDLTSSYGGFLKIDSSDVILSNYRVYLVGNGIPIEAIAYKPYLKIHETAWNVVGRDQKRTRRDAPQLPYECARFLTKPCFMVILQNVASVIIEPEPTYKDAQFVEILLDKAVGVTNSLTASTIEHCECPKEYTSLSCQDPNVGYYRYRPKKNEARNYIDEIIGVARPCHCNDRSTSCDPETGHCWNCADFTTGPHCEYCAPGYYQDSHGNCSPCLCPSEQQNFAISCVAGPKPHRFKCICKPGYFGPKCDKCADTYFGNLEENSLCQPCNCDPYGSETPNCHKLTGSCTCKPGFTGRTCSQCLSSRQIIHNGICTPCDECTQILFHTIDELSDELNKITDLLTGNVPPPWSLLNEMSDRYKFWSDKFDDSIAQSEQVLRIANMTKLKLQVDHIEKQVVKAQKMLLKQQAPIDGLVKRLKNATKDIIILDNNIRKLIEDYDGFASGNAQEALQEAKKKLQDIKYLRKLFEKNYDSQTIEKKIKLCKFTSNQLKQYYTDYDINPEQVETRLNKFKERLDALNDLLDETGDNAARTKKKNKRNSQRIAALKRNIGRINDNHYMLSGVLVNITKNLEATTNLLDEVRQLYEILPNFHPKKANEAIDKYGDNYLDSTAELDRVSLHVQKLLNDINNYKELLNFTKDELTKIDASSAYDHLIKGIERARIAANEAQSNLKEALDVLYPTSDDSLLDQTNLAKAYSDRLNKRIINLKNPLEGFKQIKEDSEKLRYAILQNGRNNNDLTAILHNMIQKTKEQSGRVSDLEKVKDEAQNVSNNMTALEQRVKDIKITVQYELVKNYHKYLNLSRSDEIKNLAQKIVLTRTQLDNINTNFTNFDLIKQNNENKCKSIGKDLEGVQYKINDLANKIRFAKEAAHSVNIAMSIANCKRRYKLTPGVLHSVSITFKCRNCILFSLTNSKGEFLIITVEDGRIKVNWNNETRKLKSTGQTDTVSFERLGPVIKIKSNDAEAELQDRRLFKIDDNDFIELGSLSDNNENAETACIHKILFNEQVLGFWNFATTAGKCPGCQKDTSTTATNVLFMADSYRNVTGAKTINPTMVNVHIFFTTFDENSLIFLAQDKEDLCSYIAVTLNDGHIQLQVRHVDGTNVTLMSEKKFNNGLDNAVTMALLYDRSTNKQLYTLSYFQSSDPSNQQRDTAERPLKISNVFKIKKSEIFIGGIPGTFNKTCIPVATTSFLGYLKPADAEYSDPVRTASYNTKLQDGELRFIRAWFPGRGFLEMVLNHKYGVPFSLSFLLKSANPQAFIMNLSSVLDLFVKNDKLGVRINNKEYIIDKALNSDINFIELNLIEGQLSVLSNNYNQDISQSLTLPDKLVLYLGHDQSGKYRDLNGEISNIVINGNIIPFDAHTVRSFTNVAIGREMPLKTTQVAHSVLRSPFEVNNLKEMQNTEGCPLVANYETDPDAVKFGDKSESYIFIEKSFWKQDYSLELQFRTFYPDGILFVSKGPQQHYNLLEIQDGRLRLRIKGKKAKTITFPERVNDGIWHQVNIKQVVAKKKRRLTLTLDGNSKKPMNIPRNHVNPEIYVGGVPNNYLDYVAQLKNQIHPFRGCIRLFRIDNILQTLIKNRKNIIYNNIGQCFPNVEKGAYFGGDAYAIYKSNFKVNKILELSLEFRTTEQNGILLSVSNPGNSPALSVELQNGAVVMSIDMGNGAISNVTNKVDSDFLLCNNRWHNITALYSSSELTVNVDGIRKSWVNLDVNSLMDEIEAALYIGGLPDNAPTGTLKIKENFKGCIRKLKMEDYLMDWTDMKELNNVLLNACPVVTP